MPTGRATLTHPGPVVRGLPSVSKRWQVRWLCREGVLADLEVAGGLLGHLEVPATQCTRTPPEVPSRNAECASSMNSTALGSLSSMLASGESNMSTTRMRGSAPLGGFGGGFSSKGPTLHFVRPSVRNGDFGGDYDKMNRHSCYKRKICQ